MSAGPPPLARQSTDSSSSSPVIESRRQLLALGLGALGVVYGDIGTSPLYAVKECFHPIHGVPASGENVLGVLSLIFWSLALVVAVKYLSFVMRASNRGEGGMMALLALVTPSVSPSLGFKSKTVLVLCALFGTALLFGEGMITPAISVLSAVEGLEVATTALQPLVVPLTLAILAALFLVQRRGTARVGAIFGPAMLVWFAMIAALGLRWIVAEPAVLWAFNPYHAVRFFVVHGWHAFFVLGAVVLCITGTEALYADMGHFGPRPIRLAWFALVMPSLILNYLGQGAIVLARGKEVIGNPFYALAEGPLLYPVVAVATVATVIASQALISGGFSLAQQAMQLGYSPRLHIVHTSKAARGQIFIPEINQLLMVACFALVLSFRSSTNLAAAYGVSVMGAMTITSILIFTVMRERWGWSRLRASLLLCLFLCVDLPFLAANLSKLLHGGWVPLAIGSCFYAVFTTWKRGRRALADEMKRGLLPVAEFMPTLETEKPVRVPGTAVFMTSNRDVVPPVLLHHFKHNKVLHEQVILLYVVVETIPDVPFDERVELKDLGHGFFQVIARYGFMQYPNVPQLLEWCELKGLKTVIDETSFFLGRETLLTTGPARMMRWRKGLFAFLSRNARPATAFFGIPPNRVVEMGMQIEL